jgi:2-polyprenyl-3-methyl-5-hydroxy-6-metoxy-1,4-benzoquinol methylase
VPFSNREYWEKRLRDHFGLEGVGYLRLGRRFNQWMYRVRGEVFDRVVAELPLGRDRPLTVMDIGAGTGFYLARWLERGARVTGVDLTQVVVENLSRQFPSARLVQADIGQPLEPPLADELGSYRAISAFDVLFHVVDDQQFSRALANVAQLLEPGGWFLWSDNFIHRPTMRVEHQVSRSLDQVTGALGQAGLEIVSRVPMFVLMNYPADSDSKLVRWAWTAMVAPAMASDLAGGVLGAMLFPLERRLVRRVRESPSTELMICRRPVVG